MSHTTPATYLVWSLLSSLLGLFLVFHLWKFDKFKCLKLNNGPYAGAFKRLMTYTYLLSVPGIITYAVGFAVIKYKEGFIDMPPFGIIPTPWQLWSKSHRSAILPLYLLFSISWSLEMVTHLEELCFWLFLVNAGSIQQDWFRSLYFRTWIIGSVVAVVYMPLVTIFTREDPVKCEAYIFLAGSLGSLSLTLWFMPILWTFPTFINNLKRNDVDIRTIVRLTTFHELNCLRVVFRFLFVAPLLVLAVDGIRPHQHINDSAFGTEFLTSVAAIGCVISSAMTLVIFFPRSVEGEIQTRHESRNATREKSQSRPARNDSHFSEAESYGSPQAHKQLSYGFSQSPNGMRDSSLPEYPYPPTPTLLNNDGDDFALAPLKSAMDLDLPSPGGGANAAPSPVFLPNRRVASGVVIEGRVMATEPARLTEGALAAHDKTMSTVHPFLRNFTSPIDIMEDTGKRWYVKRQHIGYAV